MKNYLRKIALFILLIAIIVTAEVPTLAETSSLSTAVTMTDQGTTTSTDTTADLRMQPLRDKYNSLTQVMVDTELAKFKDSTNHWGKGYIAKISALEIIAGYGNGKFGPNDKLLGGQYILMLVRIMGFKPDVTQGTPYYQPFVNVALKEGILKKGEIADYMKPISRELAASLARRVIGTYEAVPTDYFLPGVDSLAKGDKGFFDNVYVGYQKLKMIDYPTITSKYLQDVIDCYRIGLLTGSSNKFNPKGNLTRAEASVIIVKLLDKSIRVESVPSLEESFKFTNPTTMDEYFCSDEFGWYENKEYTFYKGYFPLMELWDTAYAMHKFKDKINGGVPSAGFTEKTKGFGIGWFINTEIEEQYRLANWNGLVLSQNNVDVYTQKTQIKKGQKDSIYDNVSGYLYYVSSSDVDNYNKALKPYVYELLKVWFGDEYGKAKKLHDQYLGYALRDEDSKSAIYMLNGRQVYFTGGHNLGGRGFAIRIWAKDVINKDTMFKE